VSVDWVVVSVVDVVVVLEPPGSEHGVLSSPVAHGVGLGVGFAVASGATDAVGIGAGVPIARVLTGLRRSATSPARRTVAAKAPRRAALIQVTSAERV
jgi:hypothetical protein